MKSRLIDPLHCLLLLATFLLMASWLQAEPPVKIYILAGQSNMQGKASVEGEASNTLRYMVEHDPRKEFQSLVDDQGEWVERWDVWIHYDLYPWGDLRHGPLKPGYGSSGGQIGPELGFGWVIGDATDQQMLLIKVAWGGKSLCHDFQSPGIGKHHAIASCEAACFTPFVPPKRINRQARDPAIWHIAPATHHPILSLFHRFVKGTPASTRIRSITWNSARFSTPFYFRLLRLPV